jgi:long-chain fatty acid transport protein
MLKLGARSACAVALGGVIISGSAYASGFALREGDADWSANAFAGETAKAYGASTAYANPAGMVRINRNEINGDVSYIAPSARFTGQNFVGPTATTPGTQGFNVVQDAVTAASFGVWSYSPDLKFGYAVTAPFGERVNNTGSFVGRYQSIVSSVSDINVSLSAAYRVNEHFSIGGGPVVDYFEARLTQAINIGPASALTGDPDADLHGHDTGVGFNIGALYQFNDNVRVGLDYRSRIVHGITGSQSIYVPPALSFASPRTAAALAALNSTARTKITLPDSVTLGGYWQINPQWAVMADVQWTEWSLVDAIHVTPTNGAPGSTIGENFRDTWFGAVGVSYRPIPVLNLQGGVGYDESPTTDANRTTRIPDYSRFLIGVGATYDVTPNLSVTASYVHLFADSVKINNSASSTAGVLVGKYDDTADSGTLGVTLRF